MVSMETQNQTAGKTAAQNPGSNRKDKKGISLLDLQKALLVQQQRKLREMKGGVLVTEIPMSRAGFYKDDKRYITVESISVNSVEVLQNCLGRN